MAKTIVSVYDWSVPYDLKSDRELPLIWINQGFTVFIRWLGWPYMKMDQAASRYQVVSLIHPSLYKTIKHSMLYNTPTYPNCWLLAFCPIVFNHSWLPHHQTFTATKCATVHTGRVAFRSAKRCATEWKRYKVALILHCHPNLK